MDWQFFKNNPFIRIIPPFIAGIIVAFYSSILFSIAFYSLIIGLLITLCIANFVKVYQFRWVTGFFVNVCIFLLGVIVTNLTNLKTETIHSKSSLKFKAIILEPPVEKERYLKTSLHITSVFIDQNWKPYKIIVAAKADKDSMFAKLKAGQLIEFEARLRETKKPLNPFDFDYSKYLKLNGFNTSVFIKESAWKIVDKESKGLKQRALNLRKYLIRIFEKAGITGDELGVVSALVLGYQEEISSEVKQSFRVVGATHILSVSGMHVGIIFIALEFLFNLISLTKKSRIRFIIIAAILWFYAFITGLSPSVLRATVMFSFVLAGKLFDKPLNIYNSLAASAFFILLFNPYLLFNIGFQLSYIAVIGIVFFHPKIYGLYKPKHLILDKAWELTAISVAAQIATLPLCLYYFNQFPTYFWLSNLVVTPVSTLLIFMSIFLLFISPITWLVKGIGWATLWLAKFLNGSVVLMAKLPFASLTEIYPDFIQLLLIIGIIILSSVWLLHKNGRYFVATLGLVLLLVLTIQFQAISKIKNKLVCVYYLPKGTALQFIDGRNAFWYWQNANDTLQKQMLYQKANQYWRVKTTINLSDTGFIVQGSLAWQKPFFVLDTLKGMVIDEKSKHFSAKKLTHINYLMICGDPSFTYEDLDKNISIDMIILDGSAPPWLKELWTNNEANKPPYVIYERGAFISQ